MQPGELLFWGVMSLGIIAGFVLAYPANVWMVSQKLKHGLMTERKPGSRFDLGAPMENEEHAEHAGMPATPASATGHQGMTGEGDRHGMQHGGDMTSGATWPQIAAVSFVSLVALITGMTAPANWVNMTLSARDVGSIIMPRGMIMDRDTPADAMRDMAFADPRYIKASYGIDVKGDQDLPFRMENGVKVFELRPAVIKWTILPGVTVDAYAYNGQIPGPRIHIKQGDRVRIEVHNDLPQDTTVHWHGLILPNQMDGPAYVTQPPIKPGGSYTYEFNVEQHGTYFYHPHAKPDRTQALGLYGALIIDPANPADEVPATKDYVVQLQEWLMREGLTYPAMPMDGGLPNYFTINGKAYPSTDTIRVKVGETLKVRFIGTNNGFIHPMHIHGGPFQVVARDGETIPESARFLADTVNVGPGQRYDVIWLARKPGKWLVHCHIPHHTSNNNVETKGGGGLMLIIEVSES
jgi:manganese oxidase